MNYEILRIFVFMQLWQACLLALLCLVIAIFLIADGPHTDSVCSSEGGQLHCWVQPVFELLLNNLMVRASANYPYNKWAEKDWRSTEQMYHMPVVCSPLSTSAVVSSSKPRATTAPLFCLLSKETRHLVPKSLKVVLGHEINITLVLSKLLQRSVAHLQDWVLRRNAPLPPSWGWGGNGD